MKSIKRSSLIIAYVIIKNIIQTIFTHFFDGLTALAINRNDIAHYLLSEIRV